MNDRSLFTTQSSVFQAEEPSCWRPARVTNKNPADLIVWCQGVSWDNSEKAEGYG